MYYVNVMRVLQSMSLSIKAVEYMDNRRVNDSNFKKSHYVDDLIIADIKKRENNG